MSKRTLFLVVSLLLLALAGLVWWLTTKKPITATITKAVQPTLNSLVQNIYSKAEVNDLIAHQTASTGGTGTNPGNTGTTGTKLDEDYTQTYLDARGNL